jgi:hypothetical protein
MATTNERVSVLETKVDELKDDVSTMRRENREDHGKVIKKLEDLQNWKNYWLGAIALLGPIVAFVLAHIDITDLLK